jgi:hypothetical protein
LQSLSLPALTSTAAIEIAVNGDLGSVTAPLLETCCGPNRLNSFRLLGNTDLTVLNFAALTTVDADLLIRDNDALTTLCGFQGLTDVTRVLTIENNGTLPTCSALKLRDQTTPQVANITGNASPTGTPCAFTCP